MDERPQQARSLRECLRVFVTRHAGAPLSALAIDELYPLNGLLARDQIYRQIEAATEIGSRDDERPARALPWCQERVRE